MIWTRRPALDFAHSVIWTSAKGWDQGSRELGRIFGWCGPVLGDRTLHCPRLGKKNGASVVVNDIGRTEEGGSTAEAVASEIEAASAYLCWLVRRFGFAFGFSCLFAETTGHRSYLLIRSQ